MIILSLRRIAGAFTLCIVVAQPALAQPAAGPSGQPVGHVHYSKPEQPAAPSPTGQLAPRLQNLGTHTFPVSTKSAAAQRFMNQGLNLSYGFNHLEAGRAYAEAARLDPRLAMAWWGQALVLGPNINALMDPAEEARACELVQKAVALKVRATPREAALIDALARRYSGKAEDRAARDTAYATAMAAVVKRFPNDLDAATLYAESLMDLRPWGYWMPDGRPHEGTTDAVRVIESVMARSPKHPGAVHLYIHLMESVAPEKAEGAADRLLTLMPAAGHMVHMPSHIYQRVGRFADAVKSNQLAVVADEDYISQCRAQGLYPMGYYPHNLHFLWFAATMAGRGELALDAARKTASKATDDALRGLPLLAGFRVVPYFALTRFGHWDEMLKEPAPPADNLYLVGVWNYARGLAFIAKGQLDDADRALVEVRRVAGEKALDFDLFSPNSAAAIFAIAPEVLAGELAAARKNYDAAIAHLERAVRLEDGLIYTEPSEWHYPPRQTLGAVLLEAGRPAEAETVYWQDLKQNPDNGWALTGLHQALEAQGKKSDAAIVAARLKKAWSEADVRTTSSRLLR
jgi:tetratricopeptide (TPR) repeat protein